VERLTRGPHRGPKNCVKALLKAFPEYRAGYNSYDAATYDELDKYQTWFSQNVQDPMQLSGDRLMEMLDAIPFPWMDIIGIPFLSTLPWTRTVGLGQVIRRKNT
jgi:hypothetical protein